MPIKRDPNTTFFEKFPSLNPVKWDNLVNSASIFPEHEKKALALVRVCLGFLPKKMIYMPHEPFIRVHTESHKEGMLSDDDYIRLALPHIRDIRNDYMRKTRKCRQYDENDHYLYRHKYERSIAAARRRLCSFLGYEPAVDHCLEAEMMVRIAVEAGIIHELDDYCAIDFEAGATVRYREIFFTHGHEAALASELTGLAVDIKRMLHSV